MSVIAKQFEFLPAKIEVKLGQPTKIYLTSIDATHGFHIEAFKINVRIEKGKVSVVGFTPDKAGEFEIRCSSFCGVGHPWMRGKLIVSSGRNL